MWFFASPQIVYGEGSLAYLENLPAMTYLIDQCIVRFVPAAAPANGPGLS